jgi:hypothetical protein
MAAAPVGNGVTSEKLLNVAPPMEQEPSER